MEKLEDEVDKNRNGIHGLDNRVVVMETKWNSAVTLIKFIFGTSLLGTLISILTLLRILEVI